MRLITTSLPLIIDPEVDWMIYLGGSGEDAAWALALDAEGNPVLAGRTESRDFAGANNAYHGDPFDVWVAKTDPSGALIWMTYLGGSGDDLNYGGIVVDSSDNILVNGGTSSTDFAGSTNAHYGGEFDGFLVKFDLGCQWDLDGSGAVGTGDLLELFAQWGTAGPADFDESGAVGTSDLLILFANWGPCG